MEYPRPLANIKPVVRKGFSRFNTVTTTNTARTNEYPIEATPP